CKGKKHSLLRNIMAKKIFSFFSNLNPLYPRNPPCRRNPETCRGQRLAPSVTECKGKEDVLLSKRPMRSFFKFPAALPAASTLSGRECKGKERVLIRKRGSETFYSEMRFRPGQRSSYTLPPSAILNALSHLGLWAPHGPVKLFFFGMHHLSPRYAPILRFGKTRLAIMKFPRVGILIHSLYNCLLKLRIL
ncbi:hypothetical protein, partial [Rufibacter sp. LB8]|uniref:hypothetical protein n=1 Tax=Rufibacter sp. LB8 TaxID=2777781 RepID=UPI001CEF83D4